MPIYAHPVRVLMKEMAAELAPSPTSVFSKQQAIDWFAHHYPKIKTGTITAHLIRLSTNAPSRTHYNAKLGEDDAFFQLDGSHFRTYNLVQDPSPIGKATPAAAVDSEENEDEASVPKSTGQFAFEADLRNYLGSAKEQPLHLEALCLLMAVLCDETVIP